MKDIPQQDILSTTIYHSKYMIHHLIGEIHNEPRIFNLRSNVQYFEIVCFVRHVLQI